MAEIEKPVLPEPFAQEAKTVGDSEVHAVEPEVVVDQVDAQVVQPREADANKVHVHETSVAMDRVITDPSDPLAVQIPDAGRGSLDLPIHSLAAPTVEEVFAKEASEPDEPDEEPSPAPSQ